MAGTFARWILALVGLFFLLAGIGSQIDTSSRALAATPTRPATAPTAAPIPTTAPVPPTATPAPSNVFETGNTFTRGGWAVTPFVFWDYDAYTIGRTPTSRPQGKYYVAEMLVQNLQTTAKPLSSGDFTMVSPDGRQFIPSSETIFVEHGFLLQNIQPGLSADVALVFDLDPKVTTWTITAVGIPFTIPSLDKPAASPTPR